MRILLTNDDGIDAPGMAVLAKIARELSDDVWIVAPQTNHSGAGHSLTLGRELSYETRAEKTFALAGTPADCVIMAINRILDGPPDLVLSGVNNGENVGDTVHCSGTIAAAREASLNGILGIALSQGSFHNSDGDRNWSASTHLGAQTVRQIIDFSSDTRTIFNINFPKVDADQVSGIHIVPHARFDRALFTIFDSDNTGKYFIGVEGPPGSNDGHHDMVALYDHDAITVSPLQLQTTDFDQLAHMQKHFKSSPPDAG